MKLKEIYKELLKKQRCKKIRGLIKKIHHITKIEFWEERNNLREKIIKEKIEFIRTEELKFKGSQTAAQ